MALAPWEPQREHHLPAGLTPLPPVVGPSDPTGYGLTAGAAPLGSAGSGSAGSGSAGAGSLSASNGAAGRPGAPIDSPDWSLKLARASAGETVTSVYQPIVDLARGVIVGYESLARFVAEPRADVEQWFVQARAHGCAAALEAAALRRACAARPSLPPNTFLTVNVSPDLLLSDEIRRVWREEGDLTGMVIELTEQVPIESYGRLEGDLAALRSAGALIAVDDAGAGYAGLRHLLALRPAIIKLDRALVENIDRDEAKLALVEMIGRFAGQIDAWLLAEGVERAGELDVLADLGVPLAQGYFLGSPEPAWSQLPATIAHRLAERRAHSDDATVRNLVEPVLTASNAANAAAMFALGSVHAVVVIDEHARPLAVYTPEMSDFGISENDMRLNIDTPTAEALARAMTREPSRRFHPLICTDNAGRLIGIVRMEPMIRSLLRPKA